MAAWVALRRAAALTAAGCYAGRVRAAARRRAQAARRRDAAERTQALLHLTDAALAALPPDAQLPELLRRVVHALRAEAGAVLLVEERTGALEVRATWGRLVGDGVTAQVMRERGPVVRRLGTSTAAGVPLIGADGVLGVLRVTTPSPRGLPPDDLSVLLVAADRAAIAVERARLVAHERAMAGALRVSMLPERVPEVDGVDIAVRYRPAGAGDDPGGDLYDLFAIGADRWVAVIADVCGKGPEAAAVRALVHYTLRAEALHENRPGELLGLLNDAILSQRSDLRFCTAVCLVLDLGAVPARAAVSAGGHPLPMVLRGDGAVEEAGAPAGPLVGVMADVEFPEHAVDLLPGDAVVLYTDGLPDARAPERILEPVDVASLLAAAPSGSMEELLEDVERRAIGDLETARDDVALLAMRVDADRAPGARGPAIRPRPGARAPAPCRLRAWVPAGEAAARSARAAVRRQRWLSPAERDALVAAAGELVAGAVMRGGVPAGDLIGLNLTGDRRAVRLEVSTRPPGTVPPPPAVAGRRGVAAGAGERRSWLEVAR